METIHPRLIPCQKWAALKSLPYKMVRLDTFAFVEISVKERKTFCSSTEYAAASHSANKL